MKRLFLLLIIICTNFLHLAAMPITTGYGCMDDAGKIFQLKKKTKGGQELSQRGLLVYTNNSAMDGPDICFDVIKSGQCLIEGRPKTYNEVYVNVTTCPKNNYLIPLIILFVLGVSVYYRIVRK